MELCQESTRCINRIYISLLFTGTRTSLRIPRAHESIFFLRFQTSLELFRYRRNRPRIILYYCTHHIVYRFARENLQFEQSHFSRFSIGPQLLVYDDE